MGLLKLLVSWVDPRRSWAQRFAWAAAGLAELLKMGSTNLCGLNKKLSWTAAAEVPAGLDFNWPDSWVEHERNPTKEGATSTELLGTCGCWRCGRDEDADAEAVSSEL